MAANRTYYFVLLRNYEYEIREKMTNQGARGRPARHDAVVKKKHKREKRTGEPWGRQSDGVIT